jgi:hypothetical protein
MQPPAATIAPRSGALARLVGWLDAWSRTQSKATLLWRVPVLLYMGLAGAWHLLHPQSFDLFTPLTYGFHELGHVLFSSFGTFLFIAGGSIMQLLVPCLMMLYFVVRRQAFGIGVMFYWLAYSLFNLSVYISDARAQLLPLESPFQALDPSMPVIHDWHYLLDVCHLLPLDTTLGLVARLLGGAFWVVSLGWCGLICRGISRGSRQ